MKRFARLVWAAGVLGGLLAGVQTLAAAPTSQAENDCRRCVYAGNGLWYCYDIGCGEA